VINVDSVIIVTDLSSFFKKNENERSVVQWPKPRRRAAVTSNAKKNGKEGTA